MTSQTSVVKELVNRLGAGETQDFTPRERDAAREISKHVGVRKDAGGDLIVAWFPFVGDGGEGDAFAESLAIAGGQSAADLHLTLAYLGDPADYDLDLIAAAIKLFSTLYCYGNTPAKVGGLGRFIGEGDQDILVALVDSPDVEWLHDRLCDCLSEVGAWHRSGGHGFIPHITLAYVDRTQASPPPYAEPIEFEIASLTVAAGPARATFDFPCYEEEGDDRPFYASRRDLVEKAGKVLSAKNLKLVKAAADALEALISAASTEKSMSTQPVEGDAGGEEGLLEFVVTKSNDEDRYTFGPLYAPMRKDAHGEFVDAEELQKATWEYVRETAATGRRINKQHEDSGASTIGEWVEVCAWPYESVIKVAVPGEETRELVMPAGTVYVGVVWDEGEPWELVKSKKLTGLSLGGRAVRISEAVELEHMGDKLAARKAKIHEYKASEEDPKKCADCGMAKDADAHVTGT